MSLSHIFTLDPGSVLYTIISFLLLLFLLGKFAWKPILGALEAREKGVRDDIERARSERQAAEEARTGYEQSLADARRQAQAILGESRDKARAYEAEQLEATRLETEKARQRAAEELEREARRVKQGLQAELVDLSLAAAEQVLKHGLKREDHEAIIRESLKQAEPAT